MSIRKGTCPLRLEHSTRPWQAGVTAPPSLPPPSPETVAQKTDRPLRRPLRGLGVLAHLPLVPMQQGRPLILQSMCNKPVWLLWACSVQI